MTYHGSITDFHPETEDWTSYTERMQYYFEANDIASDDKQRSILLTVCGIPTLKLIKSLIVADRIKITPYKDIIKTVQTYYAPPPSPIVQRYKFNTRVRATIVQFIAALRHLSEYCNYGDSLADMLRDRLVCRVNHEGIQRKLLSEKNLTYNKAYELAVTVETAERDTRDLSKSHSSTQNIFYNS